MIGIITTFINILGSILVIAILIRALMSWFMPSGGGFMQVLVDITEPILGPVRRILPPVSGIDFSPILAMVLIQVVKYLLITVLVSAA